MPKETKSEHIGVCCTPDEKTQINELYEADRRESQNVLFSRSQWVVDKLLNRKGKEDGGKNA